MVEQQKLEIRQNNDERITFTVYEADGLTIQDLTGCTVEFYRKESRYAGDQTATIYTGTLADDPTTGVVVVAIPAADNNIPSVDWWRLDVVLGDTQRRTANLGPLSVIAV